MKHMMIASLILMSTSVIAAKSDREKAKKLYTSLTGTQPNSAELDYLEQNVASKGWINLGREIVDQRVGSSTTPHSVIKNGGAFYNVTIKDWATPKFNKQRTTLAPLNDATALIVGTVRDDKAFNSIFTTQKMYKGKGVVFQGQAWYFFRNSSGSNGTVSPSDPGFDLNTVCPNTTASRNKYNIMYMSGNVKKCVISNKTQAELASAVTENKLYIPHLDVILGGTILTTSNEHFESISAQGLDLSDKLLLQEVSQAGNSIKTTNGEGVAGIMSTRGFGSAYYIAGTNRAPVAYVMENFMCHDMESLHDTSIPDYRNRRDVDRSPGGSSDLYKNRCIGCHAGMDGLAGAFAYYDFVNGAVTYKPGEVVAKMNWNVSFAEGYVTSNDGWINLWKNGQNSALGWPSTSEGSGAADLGAMYAYTDAFHSCMAQQAYEKVCMKKPKANVDKARVAQLKTSYLNSNYNLKTLFINAAIECMED